MRGSSPLKGALLGLVLQRPGHGYDLANRLTRRLGPAWQIEAKSIYPMLQQLERAGLLCSQRISHAGPTGQRVIYNPTGETEAALKTWMATIAHRGHLRGELQAKLAVARSDDVPQLLTALDCCERDCLELIAASAGDAPPVRSFAGLAIGLTRAASLARLEAELQWIRLAREALREFTGRGAALAGSRAGLASRRREGLDGAAAALSRCASSASWGSR
jgi:DNA-binding PadR family transcriptional regulator